MWRNVRRYLLLLLGLAVVGVLLYHSLNSVKVKDFQWSTVIQTLRGARIAPLLFALVAIYVCYALRAVRWMHFSRTLGKTHFWNVYSAQLMGFACLFILGRAGDPVRPVLVARKDKLSISRMFGVYFLERVFDIAATVVLAGVALLFFERPGRHQHEGAVFMSRARPAGVALLAILGILIAFLIYFKYHGASWLARKLEHESWRLGLRAKIAALLEGFSEGLQGIRNWGDLAALILYTTAHWMLVAVSYLWIAHAFGGDLAEIGYSGAVLVLAFSMVGSAVQLPLVGGGAQAATIFALTNIFGIEREPAIVVSIMAWLITFAGASLVGIPLLFREGWSMGDLRRMAKTEELAGEAEFLAEAEHSADLRAKAEHSADLKKGAL